jgi:putative NADPH-quinone reductase
MFRPPGHVAQRLPILDHVASGGGKAHERSVHIRFEVGVQIRVGDRVYDTMRVRLAWEDGHLLGIADQAKTPEIRFPEAAQGGDYDLIVFGFPTWWFTTNIPIRSNPGSASTE